MLEFLGDSSLYERLIKPTGVDVLPEAPFNRGCDLLGDSPPAAAVDVLAPFLNAPSSEIRKDAILAIAKTGSSTITPLVRRALTDQDEYVRAYALMGLEFALNRNGLDATARHELFPDVLALLRTGKNADKATDILFRLNNDQAKDFFLSDEALQADSPILSNCLKTLANANVPVPRQRLLSLIKSLESKKLEYPTTYALSGALGLLGQQRNEGDREFLRLRTASSNEDVASGAAAGLLSSFGLQDFEQRLWEKQRRLGFEGLSQEQKLYSSVNECDNEVNNGGLAQYFVNSSGNHWPEAVASFQVMGMKERGAVLKAATAVFGPDGPSTNREARQEQLAKLYRNNDSAFDELNSQYYDTKEIIDVCAYRYVLEHPDGFR